MPRYCMRLPGWIGLFDAPDASEALRAAREIARAASAELTVLPNSVLLATQGDIEWFNQLESPIVVENGAIASSVSAINDRIEQIAMALGGAVEINRIDQHPRHAGVVKRPERGDMLVLANGRGDVTSAFLTVLEARDGYPDRVIDLESGVVRHVMLQVVIGKELSYP